MNSDFWGAFNPLRWIRKLASDGEIHSQEKFRDLIDRERSRADRTGVPFSLLVFRLKGRKRETYIVLSRLARLLLTRVRSTDEVGWVDRSSLGALLPGAGEAGARKFGSMILSSLPGDLTAPTLDVYVYPRSSKNGIGEMTGMVKEMEAGSEPSTRSPSADPAKVSVGPAGEERENVLPPVFAQQLPLWKDILDVLSAVVALILLSPLFLVIVAYIKIVSPGPAFYRQERVGFRGKKFRIWKFRTMKMNNDSSEHAEYLKSLIKGGDQAMVKLDEKKDPRIIPLGGVLRQTGLDELPQLFNVILGDMSLVGPRPCLPYEAREFDQWHTERFDTAPGLTGLWQVSGKNRTTFKDMIRFDIRYARRMSPWMEVQIFMKTLPAIIQQVRDHRERLRESKGGNIIMPGKENP